MLYRLEEQHRTDDAKILTSGNINALLGNNHTSQEVTKREQSGSVRPAPGFLWWLHLTHDGGHQNQDTNIGRARV